MHSKILAVALSFALLSGCSAGKIANNDALALAAQKAAADSELSLDEALHRATLAIAEAVNEGLDFYAPLHLEQARAALESAKKIRAKDRKGVKEAEALVEAVKVEKLVAAAHLNRERVEQVLAKSLEHRAVLEELGTDRVLPKEFARGLDMLTGAIREVEAGNLDRAVASQTRLLAYFNGIEADTLRAQWLSRATSMLDQAKDAKADKFAPKSWDAARKAHRRADDFIGTRFRDREGVRRETALAYNAAAKALNIAREVEKVLGRNEKDLEQYMLGVQQLFDAVNQHVGIADLDALSFVEQSRELAAALRDGGGAVATEADEPAADEVAQPAPPEREDGQEVAVSVESAVDEAADAREPADDESAFERLPEAGTGADDEPAVGADADTAPDEDVLAGAVPEDAPAAVAPAVD